MAETAGLMFDLHWQRGDFRLQARAQTGAPVTGLVGPSGSGKSTLLALIAGLARPDRGRIELDGEVLCDTQAQIFLPPEQRRIGIVYQDAQLFPHLSVRGNLLYGYRLRAPAERRFTPEEIIELLELGALLDRRPRMLSGGEKQRVALGRALLYSPRLLLLDEPLASLDNARRRQVLPFLRAIRDRLHLPMLYVSHVPDEVAFLTDTVWALDDGCLQAAREN